MVVRSRKGRLGLSVLSTLLLVYAGAAPAPLVTPTLTVPKLTGSMRPRVDASVDDPAWPSAAVIPSLGLCVGPVAKRVTASPTQVRVLWDADDVFVRFRCIDGDLYSPHGTAKDVMHADGDVVEIFLDPVGDARQFFELQCNPVGGCFDGLRVLTTRPTSGANGVLDSAILKRDEWFAPNWDMPGLKIHAAPFEDHGDKGWIADFALPAKAVLHRRGLDGFAPMTMRINFVRYDAATPSKKAPLDTAEMAWSPVAWGRPHRSPQAMGTLVLTDP